MAELKTRKTTASPTAFIKTLKDKAQQKDALVLLKLFTEVTGQKPVMWGKAIIGYGTYHFKYASGREGDWMLTGFSPRGQNLTLYVYPRNISPKLMKSLGRYNVTPGSCLYIKRLSDVDQEVLKQVIAEGIQGLKKCCTKKFGEVLSKAKKGQCSSAHTS